MSKQVTVNDRLLFATDRLYDAVDSMLAAIAACPGDVPPSIERVSFLLKRAKAGYDAAMTEEEAP